MANGESTPVLGEGKALLRCSSRDKYRDLTAEKILYILGLTAKLMCVSVCPDKERSQS